MHGILVLQSLDTHSEPTRSPSNWSHWTCNSTHSIWIC